MPVAAVFLSSIDPWARQWFSARINGMEFQKGALLNALSAMCTFYKQSLMGAGTVTVEGSPAASRISL
eukprot:68959-Alexandrium_andersonii.AAC.1